MNQSKNNDYLFSKLSDNIRKLNQCLLEVSWEDVDFNSHEFSNEDTPDDFGLNDAQNGLIQLLIENIPEWKRLLKCGQHSMHDYCLDIHTLSVLKKVREFEAFSKLENYDKLILLYSALLHDIEKNENVVDPEHPMKGAKKSSSILFRLGFSEDFINSVYVLINYHQVLGLMAVGKISFSSDELIDIFKNTRLLNLQAMLSIADIKSVKKNELFLKKI